MDLAARRAREGAEVLLLDGGSEAPLSRAGVPCRQPAVSPEAAAAVDGAVRTWARVWGRLPLRDGRSFRELAEWKGVSLWWMGEGFFRESTEAPRCVRAVESFLRLLEAEAPAEVEAGGLLPAEALLLSRACTARGVLYHGPAAARPRVPPGAWASRGRREAWGAWLDGFRSGGPEPPGDVPLVVDEEDAALAPVAAALGSRVIALPAVVRAASRPARNAAREGRRRLLGLFGLLRASPGVHESFSHRGVPFFDLAEGDLAGLLLARLPAAVRLYEAAREWLAAARPRAVLVAVRSRDDRRAFFAAATAAGVPSIQLRPGEGDEADRADGGPHPGQVLTGEAALDPERVEAGLRAAGAGTAAARGSFGGP